MNKDFFFSKKKTNKIISLPLPFSYEPQESFHSHSPTPKSLLSFYLHHFLACKDSDKFAAHIQSMWGLRFLTHIQDFWPPICLVSSHPRQNSHPTYQACTREKETHNHLASPCHKLSSDGLFSFLLLGEGAMQELAHDPGAVSLLL